MSLFVIFEFPAVLSPVRLDAHRGRNPDDRCCHPPDYIVMGHCRRDIVGAQDKVSDTGIVEQRRMVFVSVARGYHLCYTREYRQGG
ncbi:unnamed protein product [Staurois parvus]|uniref:Uncharacterized protein n=1 Tax=Staurois parvus TaxID=386267 RepID=A0ABN9DES6_9NEOB|nr:unnamed protein product [Staurois parvus]